MIDLALLSKLMITGLLLLASALTIWNMFCDNAPIWWKGMVAVTGISGSIVFFFSALCLIWMSS
jgi:hypothetical protein